MIGDDIEDIITCYRTSYDGVKLDQSFCEEIRKNLLIWYKLNRRKLPWRGDVLSSDGNSFGSIMNELSFPNAYGTWVSEIMLQQTRIETVIPYWIKWMTVYPTIEALSKASSEDVNKLWAGLGYYRRAQMLLLGAKKIVNEYNGIIPKDIQSLKNIPGIGPYTAGAISSIAYDQVSPIVDGNVVRVFSRILGLKHQSASKEMEKLCWATAKDVVDPIEPGDFNQALMELGATVCKPTLTNCKECPLQDRCVANRLVQKVLDMKSSHMKNQNEYSMKVTKRKASDSVDENMEEFDGLPLSVLYFPRKSIKKKPEEISFYVKIFYYHINDITHNDIKYLFLRRESKGLLANQWEFPSIPITDEVEEEDKDDNENNKMESIQTTENLKIIDPRIKFQNYLKSQFGITWIHPQKDDDTIVDNHLVFKTIESKVSKYTMKEPIIHVFSHQRHIMYVDLHEVTITHWNNHSVIDMNNDDNNDNAKSIMIENRIRDSKWMTAAEIIEEGVTTGCKKVLTATQKQLTKPTSNQITKYFSK